MYEHYLEGKDWKEVDFGAVDAGTANYFDAELARHGFSCNGRNVLEIGFGNGSFMSFARARGATVHGIEVQPELIKRARAAGFPAYGDLDELAAAEGDAKFDLIAVFDVLEHLSAQEIIDLLTRLKRQARSNETILISRFPNGDSPMSMQMQNGDFTHKLQIGGGIARQLLAHSGWSLAYIGEPCWFAQTMRERVKLSIKYRMRRLLEGIVGLLYFGRTDVSFYQNTILVAKPGIVGAIPPGGTV